MTPEAIRTILTEELKRIAPEADPASLAPKAAWRDEMDIDSMDFLNLVTALHRRLGIDIPEADYSNLDSMENAVGYLSGRLAAAASPGRAGAEGRSPSASR